MERINAFWEDFVDAPYERQWALVTEILAEEPELFDGEMVFEITNTLFDRAVEAGEIERYKRLLDQLEESVPEAYAEELSYILEWRIQIALIEGNKADVERYFYQFSPLAGEHLDTYYRAVSALAYHGHQEILYQGMRQARPYVAEGADLAEWAYGEFTEKLGDLEILHLLDKNPDLMPDDSTLQQHFAEYELTIVPEGFATVLDYRTGRKLPSWTPADFEFTKGKKKDPAKDNLAYLLATFTRYAHVEEGISRTKVEMARDELSRYFLLRHQGELGKPGTQASRKKRSQKQKSRGRISEYPLCPDAKTLDRYLAQRMGFMSFKHYETFALYELIPAWLRFLTKYRLLDEDTRQKTVKELGYLKEHLIRFADNNLYNPVMKDNLVDWPYETAKQS